MLNRDHPETATDAFSKMQRYAGAVILSSFDAPNASNFNMNGWTGISTNRLNPAAEGRGVGMASLPASVQGTDR
jgi:hypothetical protein